MAKVRRVVLDVLKPHDPSILSLANEIADVSGISGVNISIYEIDRSVENVKVTIEGPDIPYEEIKKIVQAKGGAIHSIDEVAAGKEIVEEVRTPQDRGEW
ncbi:MAG: DUF211 domain-containing protein [Candidatus Hodarchaeota archaeon]